MKDLYYMAISVMIAVILVGVTILICVAVDTKTTSEELYKEAKSFFTWYQTNMEVYETNEAQNN
jgi:hypothetical protein